MLRVRVKCRHCAVEARVAQRVGEPWPPKKCGACGSGAVRVGVIHLPAPDGKTLCGRAAEGLEILPSDHVVDDATCKVCHMADDRRMVDNHFSEMAEAALFKAREPLTDADRKLFDAEPRWAVVVRRLAMKNPDERDLQEQVLAAVKQWLSRARKNAYQEAELKRVAG